MKRVNAWKVILSLMCRKQRREAKIREVKFVQAFFILMNNAFYGRTIENVCNRQEVDIIIMIKDVFPIHKTRKK